jgi:hypothetical protein
VILGLVLVVGAVHALVTLPPPPPSGRDIPGGFAIIFLSLAVVAGVFLAVVGVVTGGDEDPVFHGHQRTVLRVLGYFLGGSLLVGVGAALTVDVLLAVAVPGVAALLALPVVLGVICWRAGEVALGAGRRLTDG